MRSSGEKCQQGVTNKYREDVGLEIQKLHADIQL